MSRQTKRNCILLSEPNFQKNFSRIYELKNKLDSVAFIFALLLIYNSQHKLHFLNLTYYANLRNLLCICFIISV